MLHIPEKRMVVTATPPVTTNGGVTCDYISMKNVIRAYIICTLTQAVGHATGIDPIQATAVAGTGAKAFAKTLPIWANEDVAASDALVKKTAAVTYNVTNDIKNKKVIFQIDADKLDVANSFDCIGVTVDDSSQATNLVNVEYVLEMRYPGASVIVD
jgi:hypothetical protein